MASDLSKSAYSPLLWDYSHLVEDGWDHGGPSQPFYDPSTGQICEVKLSGIRGETLLLDVNPNVAPDTEDKFIRNPTGFFQKADLHFNRVTGRGGLFANHDALPRQIADISKNRLPVPDEIKNLVPESLFQKYEPFFDPYYVAATLRPEKVEGISLMPLDNYINLLTGLNPLLDPTTRLLADFLMEWENALPKTAENREQEELLLRIGLCLIALGARPFDAALKERLTSYGVDWHRMDVDSFDDLSDKIFYYYKSDNKLSYEFGQAITYLLELGKIPVANLDLTDEEGEVILGNPTETFLDEEQKAAEAFLAELLSPKTSDRRFQQLFVGGGADNKMSPEEGELMDRIYETNVQVPITWEEFLIIQRRFQKIDNETFTPFAFAPDGHGMFFMTLEDFYSHPEILKEIRHEDFITIRASTDSNGGGFFCEAYPFLKTIATSDEGRQMLRDYQQAYGPDELKKLIFTLLRNSREEQAGIIYDKPIWHGLVQTAPEIVDALFNFFALCYVRETAPVAKTVGELWEEATGLNREDLPYYQFEYWASPHYLLDRRIGDINRLLLDPSSTTTAPQTKGIMDPNGYCEEMYSYNWDLIRALIDRDETKLRRTIADLNRQFFLPAGYALVPNEVPGAGAFQWVAMPVKIEGVEVADQYPVQDVATFYVRNALNEFPSVQALLPPNIGIATSYTDIGGFSPNPTADRFEGAVVVVDTIEGKARELAAMKNDPAKIDKVARQHPLPSLLFNSPLETEEDFYRNLLEAVHQHELAHVTANVFGLKNDEVYSSLMQIAHSEDPFSTLFVFSILLFYKQAGSSPIVMKTAYAGRPESVAYTSHGRGCLYFFGHLARDSRLLTDDETLQTVFESDPVRFDAVIRELERIICDMSAGDLRDLAEDYAEEYLYW
ncbi:MAG: hypothetical protein HY541_02730 [Deltaproteobacteria bacterium]|nr:hypothetical protein [Deltaproteobacteria bacterium]